jgi:putative nucleotidyltransferase with HDIG domain
MGKYIDDNLLKELVSIADDLEKGNLSDKIIKLADKKYPAELQKLAESFGMLLLRLKSGQMRLENLFFSVVESLAEAIDAKSPWTAGHSKRVAKYALFIANEMELGDDLKMKLKMAALLHDIGKLGVPEEVLNNPNELSDEERALLKKHPDIGAKILNHIKEMEDAVNAIRYHHERWDGKGYPDGLKGEEAPLMARILAIADGFDSMTHDRPYKKKLTKKKAFMILISEKGRQWDPKIVNVFLNAQKRKKF